MRCPSFVIALRLLLLLALCWATAVFAQQSRNNTSAPKAPTPAQMNMRKMTNAQRREAAARNAARKLAAGQKNQVIQRPQSGVKK